MDLKLEGFSNEELMKAIIEKALIMFIKTHRMNLLEDDKTDIINSIVSYKNGEIIDGIFERVHNELEKRELFNEELKVIGIWPICNGTSLNVYKFEDERILVAINNDKPEWYEIENCEDEDLGIWSLGINFNGVSYFLDKCIKV